MISPERLCLVYHRYLSIPSVCRKRERILNKIATVRLSSLSNGGQRVHVPWLMSVRSDTSVRHRSGGHGLTEDGKSLTPWRGTTWQSLTWHDIVVLGNGGSAWFAVLPYHWSACSSPSGKDKQNSPRARLTTGPLPSSADNNWPDLGRVCFAWSKN